MVFVFVTSMTAFAKYWPTRKWRVSAPEKQGMDSTTLNQMSDFVKESKPRMSSIIVVRNGYLVFEEYYEGNEDDVQIIHSVTKSIISALIGIALKEGFIESIDQKIVDVFPEYVTDETDPLFEEITIRHLLTMTSGIQAILNIEICFSKQLLTPPGTYFRYNTVDPHILSAIITKSTGMSALEYGKKQLFNPLGIKQVKWEADSNGISFGGGGIGMMSRDMAKIGYLYLNDGMWGRKQILTTEWTNESTQYQVDVSGTVGKVVEGYGFLWWVINILDYPSFNAIGMGGQHICVIPDLELLFVTTEIGAAYGDFRNSKMLEMFIIPSIY